MRIALMVIRLIFRVPYYFFGICWYGRKKNTDLEKGFRFVKKVATAANKAGRVKVVAKGLENIPEEDGFVFYPNHQGLYDVLAFLESSPKSFTIVIKKEASNIILLKQVIAVLRGYPMDRDDVRQSMEVILNITKDVKSGRNAMIFAEGTRSRNGNKLLEFKGGSFKCATKAKCPIVPCALIDCFKPFDENNIKPLTVKVMYLPPMYYEEYKDMKTVEIAEEVKRRIQEAIDKELQSTT